jgi:hypothetical protein
MAKANTATAPLTNQAAAQLGAELCAQDRARRLRSYVVIGRLYSLEMEKGRILFDKQRGPGVAEEIDASGEFTGRLLFASEWGELPAQQEYSEEFCKACLAICDVCNGKSKARCQFTGCGGAGQVAAGEKACECVKKHGRFQPDCQLCGGRGAVPVLKPCPSCKGTGEQACEGCRGTGKRPTGRVPGANGPSMCPRCRGSQRNGKWREQDLARFIAGKMGDYLALGPVERMLLQPVDSVAAGHARPGPAAGSSFLRLQFARDEYGLSLMVLLPPPSEGSSPRVPYFYGGAKV